MKKFDFILYCTIIFAFTFSAISFGMVLEANEKLDNVDRNFQSMKQIFFNNQVSIQKYNCIQDYEIRDSKLQDTLLNMNERTECLMMVDVSIKIYNYQQHGIEPEFTDFQTKYLERILAQNEVPEFEEMMRFVNQTGQ